MPSVGSSCWRLRFQTCLAAEAAERLVGEQLRWRVEDAANQETVMGTGAPPWRADWMAASASAVARRPSVAVTGRLPAPRAAARKLSSRAAWPLSWRPRYR